MLMMGPMSLELLANRPRLTGVSMTLAQAGLVVILAGGLLSMFPLWKSATLSPDSIERRTYWTGAAVGLFLMFIACIPNWKLAIGSVLLIGIGLISIALTWTNHLKINGRVYAMNSSNGKPDRPPTLAKDDEDP